MSYFSKNPFQATHPFKEDKDNLYIDAPSNNAFHVTEILTTLSGYTFPPYNMAGLSDVCNFYRFGTRNPHMDTSGSICGISNAIMIRESLLPVLKESFPGLAKKATPEYGKKISAMEYSAQLAEIRKLEKEFGQVDGWVFVEQDDSSKTETHFEDLTKFLVKNMK